MKVSSETIIRTIVLIIALVNQFLTSAGKNPLPFAESTIYELVACLFTIGSSTWAWWKNNSFTKPAIEADQYLAELKNNAKEGE